jgi:colanic acid biosynthesis glycosyl transferase WcaI
MKEKRVLLLGGNYYPEPTGIGKYSGEMMDWLSAQGYHCGVVTTYPYYPYWQVQAPYTNKSSWYKKEERCVPEGVPITVYRCPHYVPAIPTGMKRMLSDLSFFLSAFFQVMLLLFRKKYDFVITVVPPFQLGLLGLLYKILKGAKLIYHIQDLQIDAAQDLGMIKSKPLMKLMFGLERFILRKADFVSSISEGMIKKIQTKHTRPVLLFPNWVDTKTFHPIEQKHGLKKQFGLSANDKVVLYSGAIGEKQGLQTLLQSAKELICRNDVKFVICGSGPYKEKLIERAQKMSLTNVIFMPLQAKDMFNDFLNMADVHLVLQKANAKDLVMPSKLATILAVGGLALVTAEPETSLYDVIAMNNMGLLIEPENQSVLSASILHAIDQPHTELKRNARRYAEDYLTIDQVVSRYVSQIANPEKSEHTQGANQKVFQVELPDMAITYDYSHFNNSKVA